MKSPYGFRSDFDPRFEPGFQHKVALEFDEALLALRRELALIRFELHRHKYRPDQPRVPAGNPAGGQWTSGALNATPATIASLLDEWGDFSAEGGLLFRVAAADIPSLADSILGWLGPGSFQQNSPNGAIQFFSADRSRLIRFDISVGTSHGLRPHINTTIPGHEHIWLR